MSLARAGGCGPIEEGTRGLEGVQATAGYSLMEPPKLSGPRRDQLDQQLTTKNREKGIHAVDIFFMQMSFITGKDV